MPATWWRGRTLNMPKTTGKAGGGVTGKRVELPDLRSHRDRLWAALRPGLGWILVVAGAVTLFLGWFGVSGEAVTAKQLPYLASAGLAGMALFILAAVFLATDEIRRQFGRLDALERRMDDLYRLFVDELANAPDGAPDTADAAATVPVALPTGTTYHRADCALVAGKPATSVTAVEVDARGLRPCRVCEPPGVE
jgi:hypothetical protein